MKRGLLFLQLLLAGPVWAYAPERKLFLQSGAANPFTRLNIKPE